MEDIDLIGLVGVCVSQLRKRFPTIDGLYVLLLVLILSVILVFMRAPDQWRTTMLPRSLKVFAVVMGGYSAIGYGAEKMGKTMVSPQPTLISGDGEEKKP